MPILFLFCPLHAFMTFIPIIEKPDFIIYSDKSLQKPIVILVIDNLIPLSSPFSSFPAFPTVNSSNFLIVNLLVFSLGNSISKEADFARSPLSSFLLVFSLGNPHSYSAK